ncbi:hypothetical protein B0T21DRAFT_54560 [Apiosordaria backusii]|uniref:Uncharacterized protein n=1 Tax=Apiosordaria backusii TaxID=314023 RepID=A0AA40AMQ7_9PEZI|nr:hypothetical protein B0T21DRAFT_54560 [Apiosordaria backusii]
MPNSIQLMPSHSFSPRVDAALPPVTGSVHRGPAAPTSLTSLSIVVIVTIAIARSQNPTGRSLPQTRTVGPRVYTAPPPAPGLKRSGGPILRSKTTGEQNESFVALRWPQESQASPPRSPVDEGSNVPELAHAEPSMRPSTGQDEPNLQHCIGDHRQCSPDDGGGYSLEDSVARHGQDDDAAQPPHKRRGVRSPPPRQTTPELQTRLHRAGQARRRTIQRLKPRRSQCPSDVPEDQGQQREGGSVAPPQAQEVRANAELSMPPPASQVGVKRQRDLGRLRYGSTDDGEDYCPSVCSDTEHSEDEALRPPRRKRRRATAATHTAGGTAPQQPTRPYRGDSSREAQRPSRRPRRQSTLQRDAEADRIPAATFDEWPLENAVLQRVTMDGSPPTFMLQFTWGLCVEHGAGHRETESRGAISSAERRWPARQKSKGITKDKDKPTSTSNRARYTPADDAKILRLKGQGFLGPRSRRSSRGVVLGLFS